MDKAMLRKEVLSERAQLSHELRQQWSDQIVTRISGFEGFEAATSVGLYVALPGEVDTAGLISACFSMGKRVAVPCFDPENRCYRFSWLEESGALEAGRFGCLEPAAPLWVDLTVFDMVIVPGVVFGRDGGRIGFGQGVYDRLLAEPACDGKRRVGLAFEFQMRDCVPCDGHDVPMDLVISEARVYGAA